MVFNRRKKDTMFPRAWSLVLVQWRYFVLLLTPIVLSPLLFLSGSQQAKCGYVMVLMAVYWMTEVANLAVTSILPVVLFPLLGIMSTQDASVCYMNSTNMIFFGGITIALAVEYSGLHERVALFIILKIGQSSTRLIIGFMLTTMLLSMWISNTATTAMTIPIVDAVINELKKIQQKNDSAAAKTDIELSKIQTAGNSDPGDSSVPVANTSLKMNDNDGQFKELEKFRKILLLSVAYSANVGGTSTVTGTNPNILVMGYLEAQYGSSTGLNYATWLLFGAPTMILGTIVIGGIMILYNFGVKNFIQTKLRGKNSFSPSSEGGKEVSAADTELAVRKILSERYRSLGSVTFHEKAVATLFTILVILWFTCKPQFIKGWGDYFDVNGKSMVAGATPALFILFLLFIIPKNCDSFKQGKFSHSSCLLTWEVVKHKFPWEVIFIMGAAFALAKGSTSTGLSLWLSERLKVFGSLPSVVAVFIISLLSATLTEVMSNTAVISIFLPVLQEMAAILSVNPVYLILPATFACSYAFMLPVATPPNTLVYNAGNLNTFEMIRIGVFLNIATLLVLTLCINTLGAVMFDLHTYPSWANTTASNM